MLDSIFIGLSGLTGFSEGLKNISNNVANVNTPGFGWGYLRVTITATQLTARTAFSGTWQDSFSIGG